MPTPETPTKPVLTTNTACRACEGKRLQKILELGPTPLANSFLDQADLAKPEASYPLDVYSCEDCGLMQLIHIVAPEVLFRDYIYVSGTSDTLQKHFAAYAADIKERYKMGADSLVVEIASNDGLLQRKFRDLGVRSLGVEPAVNIAAMARKHDLDVLNEFFNLETAKKVRQERGAVDVVVGNNVMAHVNELLDFLRGAALLLKPTGGVSFEVPYLRDFIEHNEYDTIYHEHLSYFSIAVLAKAFARAGLTLYDVQRLPVQGGTIRVHGRPAVACAAPTAMLKQLLADEDKMQLNDLEFQRKFADDVRRTKDAIVGLLKKLKAEGKCVVGYGAPAKGNTQLCFCKIGTDLVSYTVDKSPLKQNKFTPGMHLPVYAPEKILEDQPDYLLIIAWNFADEIMRQQQTYRDRGGKFIVPIPEPRIV